MVSGGSLNTTVVSNCVIRILLTWVVVGPSETFLGHLWGVAIVRYINIMFDDPDTTDTDILLFRDFELGDDVLTISVGSHEDNLTPRN